MGLWTHLLSLGPGGKRVSPLCFIELPRPLQSREL